MPIEVQCAECGRTHRVNARLAGRSVRCAGCDASVIVPEVVDLPEASTEAEALPRDGEDVDTTVPGASGDRTSPDTAADTVPVPGPSGFPPQPEPAPVDDATETVLFHDLEDEDAFRREKREPEEIDMTPMVDVTFLLLIFFMVTASFSLQKSIQVPRQTTDLPSTAPIEEQEDELDPVELEIDEFGGFYVITADFEEETPGKQNLIRTLKRAIGESTEGMQLKIRVHEMAKLQALVDGMDAGTIAGFAEIQVDQVEIL